MVSASNRGRALKLASREHNIFEFGSAIPNLGTKLRVLGVMRIEIFKTGACSLNANGNFANRAELAIRDQEIQ